MLLSEVATILGEKIIIGKTTGDEFYASFQSSSIKCGSCLKECVGFGQTSRFAKRKLAEKLAGKVIIVERYSQNSFGIDTGQCNRIEIQLPEKITYGR